MDVDRINQETRDRVRSLFTQGVSKGMTMDEIADAIESPDFDDAFDMDRFIEDEPPVPEPLQPKAGRLLIQRDPEGRVMAIDAPAQKAAEPKPVEPVAMRIERDENGRISRVVPEGSEPDARIVDIMHMFRQSIDAQNSRPIEVHVAAAEPVIVPAPIVNVPAPIVNVLPASKAKVTRRVIRDDAGNIERVVEE